MRPGFHLATYHHPNVGQICSAQPPPSRTVPACLMEKDGANGISPHEIAESVA